MRWEWSRVVRTSGASSAVADAEELGGGGAGEAQGGPAGGFGKGVVGVGRGTVGELPGGGVGAALESPGVTGLVGDFDEQVGAVEGQAGPRLVGGGVGAGEENLRLGEVGLAVAIGIGRRGQADAGDGGGKMVQVV